ncbi:3264_t:CDS:2, partial [Racocetra fulgida]
GNNFLVKYLKRLDIIDIGSEANGKENSESLGTENRQLTYSFWAVGANPDPAKAKGAAETYANTNDPDYEVNISEESDPEPIDPDRQAAKNFLNKHVANLHPLTQLVYAVYDIFLRLGYQIVEGPEIETEENNFTSLNMPPGHPARAMQDTFYLPNNLLLRTQTTAIQPRIMQQNPNTEMKIISVGKVYRRDEDDATHTHQFTQVDGFAVAKNISFSHLKGTLELVVKELLGKEQKIRLRPSYFPFTEPSVEVDAICVQCRGQGCNICKKTGWVEIAGAGLIHPQVLKNCGFKNPKFTGLAFAFGLERLLMIKYGIGDIRNFYLNDYGLTQHITMLTFATYQPPGLE